MNKHERLQALRKKLDELNKDKIEIENEIAAIKKEIGDDSLYGLPLNINPTQPEEKIDQFISLFRCREDLYPRYWENKRSGKKGYSPVCNNEWKPGLCQKHKVKCRNCVSSSFLPLNEEAVKMHLEGKHIIGTYSISIDDTCRFLAADFDSLTWKEDAVQYKKAAYEFGVDAAIEISKSGNGAHAWIFFREKVPASLARKLGTVIMARASSQMSQFSLASYDRFFPNQDYLPDGGFGNLIAFPLQFEARKTGRTVFVDENLEQYEDQWSYLGYVKRLSRSELNNIVTDMLESKDQLEITEYPDEVITEAEKVIDPIADEIHDGMYPEKIIMHLSSMISIDISLLPARLIAALRRIATFANPKYFELQRMRFSTWNTPRYISCADFDGKKIFLPRGTLESCVEIVKNAGSNVSIIDERA